MQYIVVCIHMHVHCHISRQSVTMDYKLRAGNAIEIVSASQFIIAGDWQLEIINFVGFDTRQQARLGLILTNNGKPKFYVLLLNKSGMMCSQLQQ